MAKSSGKWILSVVCAVLMVGVMMAFASPMVLADWGTAETNLTAGGIDFELCPRKGIQCPMVYDPVTCDNGVTYSNGCVAFVNCAQNCVPAGDS